jgi:hypothetical protein
MVRFLPCVVLGFAVVAGPGCAKKVAKSTGSPPPADTQPADADGQDGGGLGAGVAAAAGGVPKAPPPATGNRGNTSAGGGFVVNERRAAVRTIAINEVGQLGKMIELKYNEDGKMPGKEDILAYIQRDAAKIHRSITDGDIILTGTRDHAGLWAYEIGAEKSGGIVLVAGVASRATADDVKKLMGK